MSFLSGDTSLVACRHWVMSLTSLEPPVTKKVVSIDALSATRVATFAWLEPGGAALFVIGLGVTIWRALFQSSGGLVVGLLWSIALALLSISKTLLRLGARRSSSRSSKGR